MTYLSRLVVYTCVKTECVHDAGQGILANILAGLGATDDSVTRGAIWGEVVPIMSCAAQAWQKLYIKLYIKDLEEHLTPGCLEIK